jgi:hypothetical protein
MPLLLKGISANVLNNFTDDVVLIQPLEGEVGQGIYVEMTGIIGFFQDWSATEKTEEFQKPNNFGLKQKTEFTELIISY